MCWEKHWKKSEILPKQPVHRRFIFFSFFLKHPRARENERGALALVVNKSPVVYILSPALHRLWRENRGSVNRLYQEKERKNGGKSNNVLDSTWFYRDCTQRWPQLQSQLLYITERKRLFVAGISWKFEWHSLPFLTTISLTQQTMLHCNVFIKPLCKTLI